MNSFMKIIGGVAVSYITVIVVTKFLKRNEVVTSKAPAAEPKKEEMSWTEITKSHCKDFDWNGEHVYSEEELALKASFEEAYYAIEAERPLKDSWHTGTGWFGNGRNDDLGLENGELARSCDPLTGRKIIIIGTLCNDGKIRNTFHFERNMLGYGRYIIATDSPSDADYKDWK